MDKSEREVFAMLKSMTGFGRCENVTDEYRISVEMKAANRRYLDLGIKMPKKFNYFEASIRTLLKKYIQRGRAGLFINYEDYRSGNMCLKCNRALAIEYMEYFYRMSDEFGIQNDVKVSALAKFPEVLTMRQVSGDKEHLWEILSEALKEAVVRFVESREIKEEYLKKDLLGKLDHTETLVDFIEERSPQILTGYRNRLEGKIKEPLNNVAMEESRIATEATIYADKICVDEETVCLRSHIHNIRNGLLSGKSVGRKLDFIAQEMNREANTTLSKSTDPFISDKTIVLKIEIEKIRGQIQNVE